MKRMKQAKPYLFLAISCCFLLSHTVNSSTTSHTSPISCLPHQSSTLLQLKQEFASPHPKIFENWNHTKDCCYWDGVTCDAKRGQVVGLDLSSSGIHGPLSPNSSLFNLLHLQRLNLAGNNFSLSAIPSRFEQLSRLSHLNLSSSNFSGKVPLEISSLTELVLLDLSPQDYGFSSLGFSSLEVDLARLVQNLTKLRVLHLDEVTSLSSSMPKSLVNLSSLTSLSLAACSLEGEFPNFIFHLPKIQSINMSHNSFTDGFLPEFQSGSDLKVLDISYNYILTGKLPNSVGNLKSLTILNLGNCGLSGTVPFSIANLSQLERLDLSQNSFEGPLPSKLGNLEKLTVLYLSGNHFNGDLPHSLGNLTRLEELDLSSFNSKIEILNLVTHLVKLKKLLLNDGGFVGQIPSSLGNLTQLEEVDLSWNSFSGQIPTSLGHLASLKQLSLSSNGFNGEIPSSLSNLLKLEELDLSSNGFSGHIPLSLGNLVRLEVLDLSYNSLGGQIPSTLGNLSGLVHLQLSYNVFRGKFPLSLSNLTQLQFLDLSSNQLTKLFDPFNALEKLVALTSLDLSNNSIVGVIPSSLFRIPTLYELHLDQNQLTSLDNHNITSSPKQYLDLGFNNLRQFPDFLKTQDELQILDLSNNKIEGKIPEWFWTIGRGYMSELYLSNNFISGWKEASPSLIIPTGGTWSLVDLHANNLTGIIDPVLCKVGLVVLDLSKNHLNGTIPQCLGNSSELVVLHLQDNNFHGNLCNNMFTENGCQILEVLDLSHNRLQGKVPQSLIKCQNLKVLNLGYNQMSDVFPFWLQNLPNLKVLRLASNKFHGPIWSSDRPTGFGELQILDLSFNHFSGVLPSEYFKNWTFMANALTDQEQDSPVFTRYFINSGNASFEEPVTLINKGRELAYSNILPILVSIDLSYNRFDGEIPSSIGNLQSLVVLNLSGNNFMGLIPSSLGKLTELESLDLSKNKLSGRIPQQLTDLTFLQYLDVAQNQLTGPIPQQRQFSTFPISSFEGNSGLCGPPLSKKCGKAEAPTAHHSQESESENGFGFGWKVVAVGYGCGFVVGMIIGYVIISRRPYWLARTFGGFILR